LSSHPGQRRTNGTHKRDRSDPSRLNAPESVEVFNRAIKIDLSDPLLYNNRGNSWRDARRLKEAIADYEHAIAIDRDYARAYKNRGIAYELLGDAERATQDRDRFNDLRARTSR
jgi:tetratricopeptide (TPR) repeat protein